MSRKSVPIIFTIIITFAVGIAIGAALLLNGILFLNNPSDSDFPVKGVDVSSYQGEIDWQTLAGQNIQFAFIKATEGSSFADPYFARNYAGAQETNLRIGAYHFFSYDSSGETQAANFIATVPKIKNMLPPVVDVEFYADKEQNLPNPADVTRELGALLVALEQHYGRKPIIYATEKSYRYYIAGTFDLYDLWIRNVWGTPNIADEKTWVFWQYTDRKILDGTNGKEKFIDMNVFYGSEEDFAKYE